LGKSHILVKLRRAGMSSACVPEREEAREGAPYAICLDIDD